MSNTDQATKKEKLYIGDAWLKYELSVEPLSFDQFLKKLENEGYEIVMSEDLA